MYKPERLHIKQIVANAGGGQEIHDSIREALLLSLNEKTQVKLYHNDDTFTINSEWIISEILTRGRTEKVW